MSYDAEKLKAMPKLDYESKVRPHLKSGDLFFASGNYPGSQLIQWATKSMWSHVGVIFRVEQINRVLLLESVEDAGVRFAPLSKYLKDYEEGEPYDGEIYISRYTKKDFAQEEFIKMAQAGCDRLARPYDGDEILKIGAAIVLGRKKIERDQEYICSELVWECFKAAGIEFRYDEDKFISPENIAQDKDVEFLHRLKVKD